MPLSARQNVCPKRENLRRIRYFPWADRGVRPYDFLEKASVRLVGDDAHIVPADSTDFTEIFGESGGALGSMWASTPTNIPEDFKRTVGASAPTSVGEESEKWKSVREDLTDFCYLPK